MLYAMVTKDGTAAAETALCAKHFQDDAAREQVNAAADSDVDKRGWIDCSGNEALACVICGESEFPFVILDADGVVDRVSDEDEARAYIASMPGENLRYERSDEVAAMREP